MPHAPSSKSPFFVLRILWAGDDGFYKRRLACLQLYNSDLMVASLYCWEKHIFPLAYVEVETNDEGKIKSIECRDDEWALNSEMPPLKIMQIRLAGLSRIDPTHGRRAALEIEMDGTCWELDEAGEPPAQGFARLVKREDPDVILFGMGRFNDSPAASPAGRTLEIVPALEP